MKPNSFLSNILEQKNTRILVGTAIGLVVAFIVGRQIAGNNYSFPVLIVGLAVFLLIFFKKDSVLFLLPLVLALPNLGLDIPGPWAITIEDAFIITLFIGYLSRCIIRQEKIIPRGNKIVLYYGIFLIVATISLFKSVGIGSGTFLYNLKDLMRMIELFMLFIVLHDTIDSSEKALRLTKNLLILSIFYILTSWYIYLTQSDFFYSILTMQPAYIYLYPSIILRMISIAGSTAQTGMFYALLLALAVYYPPLKKTKVIRLFRGILIAALSSCILFTFNRGTWAGILLALFALSLKGKLVWKKLAVTIMIFIAIIALLAVSFFGEMDLEKNVVKAFHISKQSGKARWIRWVSAVDLIQEHPVLGVGYNNYAWVYGVYSLQEGYVEQYGSPHNMFVDIITGTGIAGLVVFLLLLYQIYVTIQQSMKSAVNTIRESSTGLYFAYFCFIGASIFDSFFYKPHHTGILIITIWAISTAFLRSSMSSETQIKKTNDLDDRMERNN